MALVISDLSKYVIAVFMAFFTYESFAAFRGHKEEKKEGIYTRQIICMFLVHFVSFAAICLETSDLTYIIFYGFQQILLFATIALFRAIYKDASRLLINNMCMLLSIGFLILTRLDFDKALKQFKIVALSLVVGIFIPYLIRRFRFLEKFTWIFGLTGAMALTAVLVLGAVTNGSKISYSIGGYTFQPSEFVKILFVFFVAGMYTKSKSFMQVVITTIAAAFHVIVLVLSKDLGSALIFFVVYVVMVFVATRNYFYLIVGTLAGCGAGIMASRIFSHVRVRIEAWQEPWSHIDGSGYQITQSLFAIGTGGWFGMGLCQGDPTAIPYVEADFIFSAIAEELGVFFSICLILVCVSCFIAFMNVAMRLKNEYYRLIAVGLSVTYIFQIFLTIGGGTRFIPLTGVTLPLVSYGGSSVLSTLIMFCIIQGLYCIRAEEGEHDGKKEAEE
ncbi:MAG: FtsW/RodA/SpoVE family cell cycle protein [Lachnospiraceae bacterium]|nr:FtsW/RodA/SpoVE family cell cycle protein [Lachnospiraceae bacterium]